MLHVFISSNSDLTPRLYICISSQEHHRYSLTPKLKQLQCKVSWFWCSICEGPWISCPKACSQVPDKQNEACYSSVSRSYTGDKCASLWRALILSGARRMVKKVHSVISNLNVTQYKNKGPRLWRISQRKEFGAPCAADGDRQQHLYVQ